MWLSGSGKKISTCEEACGTEQNKKLINKIKNGITTTSTEGPSLYKERREERRKPWKTTRGQTGKSRHAKGAL